MVLTGLRRVLRDGVAVVLGLAMAALPMGVTASFMRLVRAWGSALPFFAFPPEVRRVVYTTNAIESVPRRLRKIIKTRGHFPNVARPNPPTKVSTTRTGLS